MGDLELGSLQTFSFHCIIQGQLMNLQLAPQHLHPLDQRHDGIHTQMASNILHTCRSMAACTNKTPSQMHYCPLLPLACNDKPRALKYKVAVFLADKFEAYRETCCDIDSVLS